MPTIGFVQRPGIPPLRRPRAQASECSLNRCGNRAIVRRHQPRRKNTRAELPHASNSRTCFRRCTGLRRAAMLSMSASSVSISSKTLRCWSRAAAGSSFARRVRATAAFSWLASLERRAIRARVGNQTGGRVFLFLYTDDFDRDYTAYWSKGVIFVRPLAKCPTVPSRSSRTFMATSGIFFNRKTVGNRCDAYRSRQRECIV